MKKFYIFVAVMIFQFAHAQNSERIKSHIIEIGQVLDAYMLQPLRVIGAHISI